MFYYLILKVLNQEIKLEETEKPLERFQAWYHPTRRFRGFLEGTEGEKGTGGQEDKDS